MKPRRRQWASLLGLHLVYPITLVGVTLLAPKTASHMLPMAGVLLGVGLIFSAVMVYSERRRRPPMLRFWEDGTGFALTVRSLRTGEAVLQSEAANLIGRDLRGVDLRNANLTGVDLTSADLRGASLRGANLFQARLNGVRLEGADLSYSRLMGAEFFNAQLRGADFSGADFEGRGVNQVVWVTGLAGGMWAGAFYDGSTRWPRGFHPRSRGCVHRDEPASRLPIPHVGEDAAERMLPVVDTLQ